MKDTLSEKSRKTMGLDQMPRRMELLHYIADNGPIRRCEIHDFGDIQSPLIWLSKEGLIQTSGSVKTYEITLAGQRLLKAPEGDVVPPPSRAFTPYQTTPDMRWGYVASGRMKFADCPSVGLAT